MLIWYKMNDGTFGNNHSLKSNLLDIKEMPNQASLPRWAFLFPATTVNHKERCVFGKKHKSKFLQIHLVML